MTLRRAMSSNRFLSGVKHGYRATVLCGPRFILAATILLVGCGSLPTINPDMAMHSTHPVKLEGTRGALSNEQSKTILARLKHGVAETSIFDRHLLLQQELEVTPLVVGNKVALLKDGPPTYASMFAAIDAAKDHINLETYILEPDEVGQALVETLLVKQLAGVQVNVVYDSVGSLNTPKDFFQPLIDAGANVLEYNPINPFKSRKGWQFNARDHRKLLVVDGKTAYVGGINISSVYTQGSLGSLFSHGSTVESGKQKQAEDQKSQSMEAVESSFSDANKLINRPAFDTQVAKEPNGPDATVWRDTHLMMEGPIVADFQRLFMETWQKQKGVPLIGHEYFPALHKEGHEVVRAIGSSPDDPFSLMYVTLISAINSAESQLYITNAYFVPDEQLLTALKDAAARGVDVRLLLPSKSDSNLVFYASRSFYDQLLSKGVKIYERQDALLHAKTAMIDGVWSTVGSSNLDWRSFLNNQEINAVVLGQDFGAQMLAMFEEDLKASHQIKLDAWRKRSLMMRFKELGARLWARLL